MVGINLLNQSAIPLVLAETIRKNTGVQLMFTMRLDLSRPEPLKEAACEFIANEHLDVLEFDMDDHLGGL
jgi:hypothetical protein